MLEILDLRAHTHFGNIPQILHLFDGNVPRM